MFGITRKRLAVILSALTMTLVLVLILATTVSAQGKGPIVHRVYAGGPDMCAALDLPPGCDANFSLVVFKYADGSAEGQWSDRFGGDLQGYGFHAVIDCLYIDGSDAWISGVITQANAPPDLDLVGWPVATRVRDNGTSANDPPDQISYSFFGEGFAFPCTEQVMYPLLDAPQGQVVVK